MTELNCYIKLNNNITIDYVINQIQTLYSRTQQSDLNTVDKIMCISIKSITHDQNLFPKIEYKNESSN